MTARDDLARVLYEHTSFGWDGEDSHLCHCGQPLGPSGATWLNAEPLWRAHVADSVMREWLPTQLAQVEADRDHWKHHAEEAGAGFAQVCRDYARVSAQLVALTDAQIKARDEGGSVHNHPPYRPVCNERHIGDQLRGACLNDDGTEPPDTAHPTARQSEE